MSDNLKQGILDELRTFHTELKSYKRLLDKEKQLSENQKRYKESLGEKLVRKSGKLKGIIIELTGKEYFVQFMSKYNMWSEAFNILPFSAQNPALTFCINATNEAIGRLESDIELGIRDKQGKLIEKPQKIDTEPPKAFIAHGGRSGILDKLREFIEALGIKPIIVELSPSRGMTVDEKVSKYIKDADFGIVLATKGGIIDTKGKETKQHPRLNVIDELERLRAAFPNKTILLLEKGVDLPSNISGLTHEPFVGQSMDRAFTAIARELVEFGILRATKPQE